MEYTESAANKIKTNRVRDRKNIDANTVADLYVPIINMPSQDFPLRLDAVFLFETLGIPLDSLVFINDVDLDALVEYDVETYLVLII
jgi:hypothetical protein